MNAVTKRRFHHFDFAVKSDEHLFFARFNRDFFDRDFFKILRLSESAENQFAKRA